MRNGEEWPQSNLEWLPRPPSNRGLYTILAVLFIVGCIVGLR